MLGHFLFEYIYPYPDCNGRIGRFLLNAMLASGGYPWTVIRVDNRRDDLSALEDASARHDLAPLTKCVTAEMATSKELKGDKK